MKRFNKCGVALIVAAAFGLTACSDGKDGNDGEDGTSPLPPVVEKSTTTNVEMIAHTLEEGAIKFEFEITNEEGLLISGLENASAEMAVLTEKGIARSRPDYEGTIVGGNADQATDGASLTMTDNGRYEFYAPMAAIDSGSEGIIRLVVGGGDNIAKSRYMVVDKTEGLHTTTTETCQSCHVDYAASKLKHPSYTAINTDGDTDLVAGCMVCHGNVVRDDGGYARNSMQKIGHINHQKFEKDFTPANCYTCHAEPVINTSIAGNGCSDCHSTDNTAVQAIMASSNEFDARAFHADKSGLTELQEMRMSYSAETTAPFKDENNVWCTTMSLFESDGENKTQLNIGQLYNPDGGTAGSVHVDGKPVIYAGAYLHGYDNSSIVGRFAGHGDDEIKTDNTDGTRTHCFPSPAAGFEAADIMATARIGLSYNGWVQDDNKNTVSFTGYSEVVSQLGGEAMEYERRHAVTADSCTTCHNGETNYHKNGAYTEGGLDCVACHNNGQDRSSKNSAPGFGPMVHSMHWGVGASAVTGEPNSAASLKAENCVSCHADGIDLYAIPNQFIRAKAFHGGDDTKMASPITANCFACHNDESALNHMEQQGGSIDEEVVADWYTQPTSESCATCHAEGKSYGIEKFHVFERME